MRTSRRYILALTGSGPISRVLGATLSETHGRASFDVDRLLSADSPDAGESRTEVRKYSASATVMLFSIPLVSRASVGSGYAVVEQAGPVVEEEPGTPRESAWFAFMTTSKETSLDQAKKALEASGEVTPYSASQGSGRQGRFRSRVDRLQFPSKYTWRDIANLVGQARGSMSALAADEAKAGGKGSATFLYLVRQAHFIEKKIVPPGATVMRVNAILTEKKTGIKTPFRVWYRAEAEQSLPLRFEYQARSFLRLTFEADTTAGAPPVRFAFRAKADRGNS